MNVVDGWVYYQTTDSNIHKVRTDGTDYECLNQSKSQYINVLGDWIYYTNWDDKFAYRIRTDATGEEKLNNQSSYYISVTDDWIYYATQTEERPPFLSDMDELWRMRPDGSEQQKLG